MPLRTLAWIPTHPDTMGWKQRHKDATIMPRGPEVGVVGLVQAWIEYAIHHAARYGSKIGDDGVLGPAWAGLGAHLRTLLNGESGRLDCGTLDGIICHNLEDQGFNPDEL